jgi:outer membrane protein W
MMRQVAAVCLGIGLSAAPLFAQTVEVSVGGGYTASEGIHTEERNILGQIYSDAEVKSGSSFNLTFGYFVNPRALVEFMYGHQFSKLTAEGNVASLDVSDMSVQNYHVNFVYHWAGPTEVARPFAFFGLGATNYSFGNLLLPGGTGPEISGDTRFSTTMGAGLKAYFTRSLGLKVAVTWTPTYIKSDAVGSFCDPFYGCWVVGDPDYSHQFDMSGGVTFAF